MVGIKGMKLPLSCKDCMLKYYSPTAGIPFCIIGSRMVGECAGYYVFERPEWCPLVKIREEEK